MECIIRSQSLYPAELQAQIFGYSLINDLKMEQRPFETTSLSMELELLLPYHHKDNNSGPWTVIDGNIKRGGLNLSNTPGS